MIRFLLAALFCAFFSINYGHSEELLGEGEGPDWNGWYWGVQAGYAAAEHTLLETPPGPGPFIGFNGVGVPHMVNGGGFTGGGHLGWRNQKDQFVFGLEGDFNFSGAVGSEGPLSINGSMTNNTILLESRWTASARATAGVTSGDFLIYGTAGFAWMNAELGITSTFPMTAIDETTLNGFVVGGGIEHRINDKISWKFEYLHMEFEDFGTSGTITAPAVQTFNFKNSVTTDTFLIKVSFKLP